MKPPPGWPRPKDRPIEQIIPMARAFPHFSFRWTHSGGLVWSGSLQPTQESLSYPIRIIHNPGLPPKVVVPEYEFDRECRHLYGDGSFCLYWPRQWWWTPGESLARTLIPWAAFWLYFYELWETTGRWLGPSSPHGIRPEERN